MSTRDGGPGAKELVGTRSVDSLWGRDGWVLTWVGRIAPSRTCRLRCSRGADIFSISPLLFTEEPWAGSERHGCEGFRGTVGGSGMGLGSSHPHLFLHQGLLGSAVTSHPQPQDG